MPDFKFKPFDKMTDEDYDEIGFMSGLEVHQQLLTEKKLFCRCPAGHYSPKYHAEILRHMRPTLSEMGEYDGTALMEFKTKKNIVYRINRDTVCTYEMDDTPPFPINEEAMDTAIEIGMLQNAKLVDEIHIARKQYLDGSIPTGFQRTAIISVGGWVPYKDRKINLIQMSIEEDSCREYSDSGHKRVYLADRLGMPLIESVTQPEMKTPQEVADVCNILRWMVRGTHKVRTGVGAARQDVNVSVRGGTRIEIKGVPSIKHIPLLTYNESMRQYNLLKLREELHSRGIRANTLEFQTDDVTKIVRKTDYKPIADAIKQGMIVKCVTLKNCVGILKWQTQTDTVFAKEVSDRLRVIACLTTSPNMIHSDYPGETITSTEGNKLRKTVSATSEDALIVVWGEKEDVNTACKEVIIRVREATIGIPSETRQALKDGTNGFERILPGPERMYPDTDLPPKKVSQEKFDAIKAQLKKPYWDLEKWYTELNVPEDLIIPLAISEYTDIFEKAVKEWEIDPVLAAVALIRFPKRIKKRYSIKYLNSEVYHEIFKALKDGTILYTMSVYVALSNVCRNGEYSETCLPLPCDDTKLGKVFDETIIDIESMNFYHPEKKGYYLLGRIMNLLKGKIEYQKVADHIKANYNQEVSNG